MRKSLNCLIASAAAISLIAPAHANPRQAAFGISGDRPTLEAGVFSGASVRLALDRAAAERSAEVKLKLASHTLDRAHALGNIGSGLQLGIGKRGTVLLSAAGQPVGLAESPDFERDNKIIYVVVALVLLGGVVLLLKSSGAGNPPG